MGGGGGRKSFSHPEWGGGGGSKRFEKVLTKELEDLAILKVGTEGFHSLKGEGVSVSCPISP